METTVLGLIAGEGRLPLLVAQGMRDRGFRVACVAFRGHAHPELQACCDEFAEVSLYRMGSWMKHLRRWNATEAIMVGGVAKTRMHDPWRFVRNIPDWRALRLWYRRLRHDKRDRAVLTAVADELQQGGIELIDSTTHISEHLANAGTFGNVAPTAAQKADIEFGWPLLQTSADMGVGQAMAVRECDVIAVEAVEGTAAMIQRAGELCRTRGWTLLKTASNDHDMRADVPTIGVKTIEQLVAAGAGALALGAGRVILLDREAVVQACDKAGIALFGMDT
jgi:DUF1009 family protein